MTTKERLIKVFAEVFDLSPEQITEDMSVDSVEQWDSLHHMRLIFGLEEEFDVQFSDTQVTEMLSYRLIHFLLQQNGVK